MDGLVFNIQRFSIHDGPGIRTTVFLKGCNLKCFWCHNPESMEKKQQLMFYASKCIGCGRCFEVCPVNAHRVENQVHIIDRNVCISCGKCADACSAEALMFSGKVMSVDEIIQEVNRDISFYNNSDGGVTFSGGEPMLQIDFLSALLKKAKEFNIHTAVDTAGNVPWEFFERIIPYTDLFLYDVKVTDCEKHRQATGCGNERILANLKNLGAKVSDIWIRIPVIPGINDSIDEMECIVSIITELTAVSRVYLMPFHSLGSEKYESLGIEYKAGKCKIPDGKFMKELASVFENNGFNTFIG